MEDSGEQLLCRVCLENGGLIPIFDTKDSADPNVFSNLCQCIGEKVEDVDGYPRHICKLCHITLNTAIKFIKKFKESTEMLLKCQQQVIKQETVENDEFGSFDEISNEGTSFIFFADENSKHFKEPQECEAELNESKATTNVSHVESELKECKEKFRKTTKTAKKPPAKKSKKLVNNTNKTLKSRQKRNARHITNGSKPPSLKAVEKKLKETSKEPEEKQPDENKPIASNICDICGKTLQNKTGLRIHRKNIHGPKAQCPQCSKVYSNKAQMKRHIRTQHASDAAKKYICTTCGKRYVHIHDFRKHVEKVHEKKNRFRCECKLCDRTFCSTTNLKVHVRAVHTGERTEVCSVCEKAFYDPQHLKEHMRLHTGERPYVCMVCGKGFAKSFNLKSHIKHNHRVSQLDEEIHKKLSACKINYLKYMQP